MLLKTRTFVLAGFLATVLVGCDRTVDYISPQSDTPPSEVFQSNEVTITEFQVVAEVGDTLELEDSSNYEPTVLIIPENLCVYGNGEACLGEMDVQLIQAFEKSDMIFSDIPTTSKRMPLESGGAFYLNITQGGEQLYIRPDALFQIKAAIARTPGDPQKMMFYRYDEVGNGVYDWRLQGPLSAVDETYYTLEFNELDRWMNIDYEIPTDTKELIINLLKDGVAVEDAQVFFSLNDFNSVGKAEYLPAVAGYQGWVPLGASLQVVALKKEGEKWYWNKTQVAPGGNNLDLTLTAIAYDDLVSALKSL
ncbi:MAG: hypothetical protein OER04_05455 [Cyclobacteriaceae bacterium]|nr:hypothetical protein [Cyclobacteriaceae bacterium]